jgi:hypothetical protein
MTGFSPALTSLLAVALAGTAHAQAAESKPPQALPDSTYLALTLELPIVATFQSTATTESGRNARRSLRVYRLSAVEVRGCELQWRRLTLSDASGSTRTARQLVDLTVPLREVDWTTMRVGPSTGADRYDPEIYQVSAYATKRSSQPFGVTDVESRFRTRSSSFVIHVREAESAHRLARLLKDAAQRCDTWNTAPLRPIR